MQACDSSWSEATRHSESNSSDSEHGATNSMSIKLYLYEPEERENRVVVPVDDSADGDSSDNPGDNPWLGNTIW